MMSRTILASRKSMKSNFSVCVGAFAVVSTVLVLISSTSHISSTVKQRSLNTDGSVLDDVNSNLYIDRDRMSSSINMNSLSHASPTSNSAPDIINANDSTNSEGSAPVPLSNVPIPQAPPTSDADVPHSEYSIVGKKILIGVPSYGQKQFLFLQDMIDSFRDLCETGAEVTLIIYTTHPYSVEQLHLFNSRTNSCYHPHGKFQIQVKIKPPSLKLHFVDSHRKDFYDNIDNYDLFIYSEDDHLIRPTHVIGYLYETAKLRRLVGEPSFPNYSIGFLRYERDHEQTERHTFDQYEYENAGLHSFANPNLVGKYIGNRHMPHQGMFMATREQLVAWKERCNFHEIDPEQIEKGRGGKTTAAPGGTPDEIIDVDTPVWHREYVSSLRLFANDGIPIGNCQVTQLFPADGRFENFMVHHMPDKYYENPNFDKQSNFNSLELQRYRLQIYTRENGGAVGGNDAPSYTGVTMELSPEDVQEMERVEGKETLDRIMEGMMQYESYVKSGGHEVPVPSNQQQSEVEPHP